MGRLDEPLNTFWQLFYRPNGSVPWSNRVEATATATNGGLVLASAGPSLLVGVRPSVDLTFTPLISTTNGGRSWSDGLVAKELAARPDALATTAGHALALVITSVGPKYWPTAEAFRRGRPWSPRKTSPGPTRGRPAVSVRSHLSVTWGLGPSLAGAAVMPVWSGCSLRRTAPGDWPAQRCLLRSSTAGPKSWACGPRTLRPWPWLRLQVAAGPTCSRPGQCPPGAGPRHSPWRLAATSWWALSGLPKERVSSRCWRAPREQTGLPLPRMAGPRGSSYRRLPPGQQQSPSARAPRQMRSSLTA